MGWSVNDVMPGYDNHNCYNKPQIGNELECE